MLVIPSNGGPAPIDPAGGRCAIRSWEMCCAFSHMSEVDLETDFDLTSLSEPFPLTYHVVALVWNFAQARVRGGDARERTV
jgi:hypothetical protein